MLLFSVTQPTPPKCAECMFGKHSTETLKMSLFVHTTVDNM